MKVHHLNCGTMHMPTAPMVCHVLLVETDSGLVLVDSGFGPLDCTDPARVGPTRHMVRAILSHEETIAHQIERLGFTRNDVRHIIITHLDMDHAGGPSDFPGAQVHLEGRQVDVLQALADRFVQKEYRPGDDIPVSAHHVD